MFQFEFSDNDFTGKDKRDTAGKEPPTGKRKPTTSYRESIVSNAKEAGILTCNGYSSSFPSL